jgi:hypothetical protein
MVTAKRARLTGMLVLALAFLVGFTDGRGGYPCVAERR